MFYYRENKYTVRRQHLHYVLHICTNTEAVSYITLKEFYLTDAVSDNHLHSIIRIKIVIQCNVFERHEQTSHRKQGLE